MSFFGHFDQKSEKNGKNFEKNEKTHEIVRPQNTVFQKVKNEIQNEKKKFSGHGNLFFQKSRFFKNSQKFQKKRSKTENFDRHDENPGEDLQTLQIPN